MKTLLLAGATLALLTAVNISPVMAQAQTHSGENSASADKMAPHYEYQYHYGVVGTYRAVAAASLALGSLVGLPLGLVAFRYADPILVRAAAGAMIFASPY